jgi:large repetitive protein
VNRDDFEGRLLRALTELDERRPAPASTRAGVWRRPAVIGGAVAAVILAGAATATAARLLSRPTFQIGGSQVPAGQSVVVKGSGCAAGAAVTVSLDGVDVGMTAADADGDFVAQPVVPVGTTVGTHTVAARCDAVRHSATVEVVAERKPAPPVLSVPGVARPGGTAVVKGTGCRPGAVALALDGRPAGTATANAEGLYLFELAVPADAVPGTHVVQTRCVGADGAALDLTAELTVVAPEPAPEPILAVTGVASPGGQVGIKGLGCRPGARVTIRLDGGPPLGAFAVEPDGSYVVDLGVPADLAPGAHRLSATCAGADGRELSLSTGLTVVAG